MALINRIYEEVAQDCLCKFRGTPEDYPNNTPPDNWTPDTESKVEKNVAEEKSSCVGNCKCNSEESIKDLSLDKLIYLFEFLLRSNHELVSKVNQLEVNYEQLKTSISRSSN